MTWLVWIWRELAELQRLIQSGLAERIGLFAETGAWDQLLVYLPAGILVGAANALTPGHSETLLATYLAGNGKTIVCSVLTREKSKVRLRDISHTFSVRRNNPGDFAWFKGRRNFEGWCYETNGQEASMTCYLA